MIDTHLHAWDLARSTYAWMSPDLTVARDVQGAEAVAASRAAGFERQILVQADDTTSDTEHLLEVAAAEESVIGVVAWVPLTDAERAEELLESWGHGVVGVRSLVHVDPDPAVLEAPATARTLRVLARRGLALDVPDAWPGHLDQARRIAATNGLTVVLDHLGKPPADADERVAWAGALREFAAVGGTVGKVSGLHHGGRPLSGDALRSVWDEALAAFGPDRLVLGTDWPMTELAGPTGSSATAEVLALVATLSADERAAVGHVTAERVYGGGR